ncbi:PPC domain-containing DNA-binding protein [Actinomadura adrarensis]|uniref:PPC domain-containing DNA-binding protein n=1 Tax=Actinomadura adrarensis TaxID=1819600 RepID=A0ABW3CU60_9ACTN
MRTHLMNRAPALADEARIFSVRLDPGDEVMEKLAAFADENGIAQGVFEAIGGFEEFSLARYEVRTKRFVDIPIDPDQVEVLSLTGLVTQANDPPVHIHTVLGDVEGNAFGGHLMRAVVQPVLLVSLTETVHEIPSHHV